MTYEAWNCYLLKMLGVTSTTWMCLL